ncbi:hypothetical protein QYF36_025083 [Acer negundo]|nr:hypothetical protein QYF36_025083 [Acer negundo]
MIPQDMSYNWNNSITVNTGKTMNVDMPQELEPSRRNDTTKPWDDGLLGPSIQLQILTPQVNTGKMMNMDTPRELGPWGGNDTAKPWDDGVFLDINEVDVHVKKGILIGIQIQYQTKNGNSVDSERHGEKSGDALYRIKLDSSSEYLIGIMGYYRPIEGNALSHLVANK